MGLAGPSFGAKLVDPLFADMQGGGDVLPGDALIVHRFSDQAWKFCIQSGDIPSGSRAFGAVVKDPIEGCHVVKSSKTLAST